MALPPPLAAALHVSSRVRVAEPTAATLAAPPLPPPTATLPLLFEVIDDDGALGSGVSNRSRHEPSSALPMVADRPDRVDTDGDALAVGAIGNAGSANKLSKLLFALLAAVSSRSNASISSNALPSGSSLILALLLLVAVKF